MFYISTRKFPSFCFQFLLIPFVHSFWFLWLCHVIAKWKCETKPYLERSENLWALLEGKQAEINMSYGATGFASVSAKIWWWSWGVGVIEPCPPRPPRVPMTLWHHFDFLLSEKGDHHTKEKYFVETKSSTNEVKTQKHSINTLLLKSILSGSLPASGLTLI